MKSYLMMHDPGTRFYSFVFTLFSGATQDLKACALFRTWFFQ